MIHEKTSRAGALFLWDSHVMWENVEHAVPTEARASCVDSVL